MGNHTSIFMKYNGTPCVKAKEPGNDIMHNSGNLQSMTEGHKKKNDIFKNTHTHKGTTQTHSGAAQAQPSPTSQAILQKISTLHLSLWRTHLTGIKIIRSWHADVTEISNERLLSAPAQEEEAYYLRTGNKWIVGRSVSLSHCDTSHADVAVRQGLPHRRQKQGNERVKQM